MATQRLYRILLIEDDPSDVRLMIEAFKEVDTPVQLLAQPDGEQAMQYLRELGAHVEIDLPHLIILDLNLPKIHGSDILQFIKTHERLKIIPVIVLSTSVSAQDIQKSHQLHANCYINKPLDVFQFFDIVRTIDAFWLKTVILPIR